MNETKAAMLEALKSHLGVVISAVEAVGISRSTHYEWLKDDTEYKAAVEDVAENAIDLAESELHKRIMAGDTKAIIFYLKTKGKKRGYVERQEIAASLDMNKNPSWFDEVEES